MINIELFFFVLNCLMFVDRLLVLENRRWVTTMVPHLHFCDFFLLKFANMLSNLNNNGMQINELKEIKFVYDRIR